MADPASSISGQFAANNLEFESISVSFCLPADVVLVDGDTPITTQGATLVTITLDADRLHVGISPGLIVHTPWIWPPCRNTVIWGLDHWFTDTIQANVVVLTTDDSSYFFSARSNVETQVRQWWFDKIIRDTPLNRAWYNPLKDPMPADILESVKRKFASGGGGSMPDLTGLGAQLQVRTIDAISKSSGDAGIEIPGGTDITFSVSLSGTASDVKAGKTKVDSVNLRSKGIFVVLKGERIMQLTSVSVLYGCKVKVNEFEILSEKIKDLNQDVHDGAEGGVLLLALGLLGAVGATRTEVLMAEEAGKLHIPQADVDAAKSIIQGKLTEAVKDLYGQNYAALQGKIHGIVNLDDVFGSDCRTH